MGEEVEQEQGQKVETIKKWIEESCQEEVKEQ